MSLKVCQTTTPIWEVTAFSPAPFQSPFALGDGVVWTGQNQTDFENYHIQLESRVKTYLAQSKRKEKHPRQPQVTIYDIKPMWLEPERVSKFSYSSVTSYMSLFPLEMPLQRITVPRRQSSLRVKRLTNKLFPDNAVKRFAGLPTNFTLPLKEAKLQYAWIRLLAWHIEGYISSTFKKRNLSKLREPNFNATILSVLPSGHLDAVVGVIEICAPHHLASVMKYILVLRKHFC